MKHRTRPSGFTIVELATVIVVIAILAALVVVSWNMVRTRARDSNREAAMTLIANQFEEYYEKTGDYPYGSTLNPTGEQVKLPNYNLVYEKVPELKGVDLDATDYDFMPSNCLTSECGATNAIREARKRQIFYFAPNIGTSANYVQWSTYNGMWGCKITATATPVYVLVRREESTGKWIFQKSKRGTATITDYNSGPIAPTTCSFS